MERSSGGASSWRPPTLSPVKEPPLVTGEDIELALRAAESLAAEADLVDHQDDITRIWASMATAVILSAAALTAALLSDHIKAVGVRVFGIIAVVILLGSVAAFLWWLARASFKPKSSQLRLSLAQDIVGIVREVMLDVAEREGWSYLRLQATKNRISAFPPTATVSKKGRGGFF